MAQGSRVVASKEERNTQRKPKGTSMLGAIGAQFISKYTNVALQLVLTAVLARLLTPAEFGSAAIVTVFSSFFTILADLGIGPAIIQFKDLGREEHESLFSFSLVLGLVLAAIFCLASYPISAIYGDPQLVPLCCVMSVSLFFNALNMVPNGLMLKNKLFKSIGVRLVLATLASGLVAIAAARMGLGVYSLVIQAVTLSTVVFVWNAFTVRIRLGSFHFGDIIRKIARYSGYQALFQIVNYFSRNLDNLLVGAMMGSSDLGYYDKAYKLMQYPNTYLSGLIASVIQPYLSDYHNKLDFVYRFWIRMSKFLCFLGVWVTVVCFFGAEGIVRILYGDQWLASVPVLQMLALSIGLQMVNSTSGGVFQSVGHTDLLFESGLVCSAISAGLILLGVGVLRDLTGLGACISLAYLLHFCCTVYFLGWKVFQKKALEIVKEFGRLLLAGVIAAAVGMAVSYLLAGVAWTIRFVVACLTISLAYLVACKALGEGETIRFLSYVRGIRGKDA